MNQFQFHKGDALIIIDPQYDFLEGGALAVEGGRSIMNPIALLMDDAHAAGATIVVTQDWHPEGHKSFATSHGVDPFTNVILSYGDQTAWPDHCVQSSHGAELHSDIVGQDHLINAIIRKGTNPEIDSYSAFFENDRRTSTGLTGYLNDRMVKRVVLVGLAYDFCVGYSAIDAREQGFEAVVLKDLTKAIAMPVGDNATTVTAIEQQFADVGVQIA